VATIRDYQFTLTPSQPEGLPQLAQRARKVLAWACEGEKRITCFGVDGDLYGLVQIRFTATGKDRWACGQLAQDLIHVVTEGLANPAKLEIDSNRLPIHDHRGYRYGRTRTWREQRYS
jgi:hypothetical protein